MSVTTGIETLDQILDGGLPEERTVLATGTPGAGKSTLAMSFLQAGIDTGEECLYVSTEQTVEELRDSFEPFSYDIDADGLTVRSIHAGAGGGSADLQQGSVLRRYRAGSEDRAKYSLQTLGDDELSSQSIALTPENLREFLFYQQSYDRVVIDSASGLRTMADDDDMFRRILLDMIQVINADLGATAIFTAETSTVQARGGINQLAVDDLIQYTVHGVIRLWRQEVRGNYRRYLDVMKMRGVAHDSRRFEVTFTDDGFEVVPREDGLTEFSVGNRLPTWIGGLDEMLDGGLLFGAGVLFQHDGQAGIENVLFGLISSALDQQLSIAIVPRVSTPPRFLELLLDNLGASMGQLLDANQLFVLDPLGSWYEHQNVFDISADAAAAKAAMETVMERARGRGTMMVFNTEAFVHTLGDNGTREFRYWVQANALQEHDLVLDVHNPTTMNETLSAFYLDAASQVIDTWLDETGLQYVQLRKALSGDIGTVRHIKATEEPPYVRTVE